MDEWLLEGMSLALLSSTMPEPTTACVRPSRLWLTTGDDGMTHLEVVSWSSGLMPRESYLPSNKATRPPLKSCCHWSMASCGSWRQPK